jgi:D-amino-acid dehydrogenase
MAKTVLIIGGGVIGLCAAWYACKKGHQVTVVERGGPEHDACSLGNAGMIVPSHFVPLAAPGMVAYGLKQLANPESPFWVRPRLSGDLFDWGFKFMRAANAAHVTRAAPILRDLNMTSRRLYEEFARESGNRFGLVQKGLLMLCKSEEVLREEGHLAERARELGVPAEVLTLEETRRLDPAIEMDVAGAVYFPQDCHLSPNRFMAGLTEDLKAAGAAFRWQAEVTGWRTNGGHIEAVRTTQGDLSADEYVIAGGAWSPTIARELRLRLPMQAGKGYSMTVGTPRQLPALCSILTEARVAVTPMGETLRFGGTMEIAGLDETVNERRVQGIIKSIPRYFPAFREEDFRGLPIWSGLRPCSPDGMPYVGRTRRYENLVVATGHSMMGLSLGPVTGQLVAEILSGESPSLDISLLDPNRYA